MPAQQHDVCGSLRYFGVLSIVEALSRRYKQSKNQGRGGGDQAHREPDGVLGIGVKVLARQQRMEEYTKHRSAEHTCKYNDADRDRTHNRRWLS